MTRRRFANWQENCRDIGIFLFLTSIPVLFAGSLFFGEAGVAWPTVLMVYPSLMLIGIGVGAGDVIVTIDALRKGSLFRNGVLAPLILLSRGGVFSMLSAFALWMEIRTIEYVSNL